MRFDEVWKNVNGWHWTVARNSWSLESNKAYTSSAKATAAMQKTCRRLGIKPAKSIKFGVQEE